MRLTKLGFVITLALAGIMLFAPRASAGGPSVERLAPEEIPVAGQKLPPLRPQMPAPGIRIKALVTGACNADDGAPVQGARIIVITDNSVAVAHTNQMGQALFNATQQGVIVQIEWPVGFIPCPNSGVTAELPIGVGEIKFVARPVP